MVKRKGGAVSNNMQPARITCWHEDCAFFMKNGSCSHSGPHILLKAPVDGPGAGSLCWYWKKRDPELASCAHCGSETEYQYRDGKGSIESVRVACVECGISTCWFPYNAGAEKRHELALQNVANDWNRRDK